MKKRRYTLWAFLLVLLVFIGSLGLSVINTVPNRADWIEIKNGNTGEVVKMEGKPKIDLFISQLKDLNPSIKGVHSIKMGYLYKVTFVTNDREKTFTVQNKESFEYGPFRYGVDGDVIAFLEMWREKI